MATALLSFVAVCLLACFIAFAIPHFKNRQRLKLNTKLLVQDLDTLQTIYLTGIQAVTLEQCLQIILEQVSTRLHYKFAHVLKIRNNEHASSFHIWHHASRRLNPELRALMEDAAAFDCMAREPYVLEATDLIARRPQFAHEHACEVIVYVPLVVNQSVQYCLECYGANIDHFKRAEVIDFLKRVQLIASPLIESILNKQELVAAKQIAQEASRVKSEFLAMMSHEIRTPLQGLLGMTKVLRDRESNAETSRYAAMAFDSAQSLYNVITNVLDYSKIESGRAELVKSSFSILEVVKSAIDNFSTVARNKGIRLDCHFAPGFSENLYGDKQRIWEVLVNLISNAIKFTEAGAVDVFVETTPLEGADVSLEVRVRDTGIGIPVSIRGQIFKTFAQGDHGLSRQYGGSGLGLAICKSLIEMMYGEIEFFSREGEGTTFWFRVTLRRSESDKLPKVSQTILNKTHTSAHVLLVEDNEVSRCYFEYLLRQMKISFDSCSDGEQALHALQSNVYDLVLLDCHLPKISGFDVARYIRKHIDLSNRQLPIIAITGYAFKDDASVCDVIGVNDYIYKPVLEEDFVRKLDRWTNIASFSSPSIFSCSPHQQFVTDIPAPFSLSAEADEFDFGLLKKVCEKLAPENRESVMREVVEAFFKSTPNRVKDLTHAISIGNADAIWRNSHSIRTSAEIFGAKRLARACRKIEEQGRNAIVPSTEDAQQFSTEFHKLEKVLKQFISSPNPALN